MYDLHAKLPHGPDALARLEEASGAAGVSPCALGGVYRIQHSE